MSLIDRLETYSRWHLAESGPADLCREAATALRTAEQRVRELEAQLFDAIERGRTRYQAAEAALAKAREGALEEMDLLRAAANALRDLLTGIDVHNSRLSGKVEQPIEGPVVKAAKDAWHAVRIRALRSRTTQD